MNRMERQSETGKDPSDSHSASQTQQDFLFVDAAQAKTSRQGRRNARSFVMQKARRERPWSTSKNVAKQRKASGSISPRGTGTPESSLASNAPTPSPPIASLTVDNFPRGENSYDTLANEQLCRNCQVFLCSPGETRCASCSLIPASPAEDIDNSFFDPFGTSSVEMNSTVSELLEHFVTEMAPGTIAVDVRHSSTLMRSYWFGTAISNPGFMHSLLCTAAMHLYIVGRGSVETILYHRAQAIAAINAAISHSDWNVGISDANIGAVFNLLTVEEGLLLPFFDQKTLNEEQPNQRATHMHGLRRMLDLRGGLGAIKTNPILQAFILWHSTAHAIASFEAPNPSTLDYISKANFSDDSTGYGSNNSQHLLDYCRQSGVKDSLARLVESVLVLITHLNAWFDDSNSLLNPLEIQNKSCALQCMLLCWLRENEQFISPLEDALCVALLIFTVRTTEALRRRADVHLLHFAASKRLGKALNCTTRLQWQACPDLLLWILSIGAISAEGSDERDWFVHQISLACAEFGIESGETLLERLHRCGWVSYKLNEAVHYLWEQISNIRLESYIDPNTINTDANSPVGPLQRHVAEPDFVEWENIDWTALSFAAETTNGLLTSTYSLSNDLPESHRVHSNSANNAGNQSCDMSPSQDFTWSAAQHSFPHWMSPSSSQQTYPQ